MGVEVFVVAVGNHFDYHELGEIASDLQHVFTVQNFFELGADNIKQVIGDKICASKFYSAKKMKIGQASRLQKYVHAQLS